MQFSVVVAIPPCVPEKDFQFVNEGFENLVKLAYSLK